MKTVAILGTFDTKANEFGYLCQLAKRLGLKPYLIHTGTFQARIKPDVDNDQVAKAGGMAISELVKRDDRALATKVLSAGVKKLVPQLYQADKFDGIISLGGSGGTSIATPAMRELPLGVPKIMVSTMASGNVAQYVGSSDIIMMPSIVDVEGLNQISKTIFRNAMLCMAGMLNDQGLPKIKPDQKPLIAATMFGVTTPCIKAAEKYLAGKGYETVVFHCTGTGGRTMEKLIGQGFFKGVLDLTTTEWCDQVVGGVLAAGPHRCEAAIKAKLPQVASIGATDMVNFGPPETVPEKFAGRKFYQHNPMVTLMRTTVAESKQIGHELAKRWNQAQVPMKVLLPTQGVSAIDAPGQAFEDKEARAALIDTIVQEIDNPLVDVEKVDCNINDQAFAEQAGQDLIDLIKGRK